MMRWFVLVFCVLVLPGCAKKAYCLYMGEGSQGTISSSIYQMELMDGQLQGPIHYVSIPESMDGNPCSHPPPKE